MIGQKKIYLLLGVVMVVSVLIFPMIINAEMKTITGKMPGLTCFLAGYICPIDKADPMISVERDFVVVTVDGKYYLLPNVGLGLKAKYALEKVEVFGDVNEQYRAIRVKKIMVGSKVVWTPEMEGEILKKLRPFMP